MLINQHEAEEGEEVNTHTCIVYIDRMGKRIIMNKEKTQVR